MIIDTHTHFYDPSRPQGVPWPAADNELLYRTVLPEHHRALAQPEGVSGTVVVEASAWVEDNQWVLDLAEDDPWILGLVGHLEPQWPDFGTHLARLADHPRFCGIRLGAGPFSAGDRDGLIRSLEMLAERDLTLDVLIGMSEWDAFCGVLDRLPQLRVVINHVAHVCIDGQPPDTEWVDGMARASKFPQVYCKVSGMMELCAEQPAPTRAEYYAPTLDVLWEAFEPQRLVYGSNWPVCERAGAYATTVTVVQEYLRQSGKGAQGDFWSGNAARAYGLSPGETPA